MSKKLVVYYSRTGNTKKVAEKIANDLPCDIVAIKSITSFKGMIGWLRAGSQGVRRKLPRIEPIEADINEYDIVIVGTPIWGGNMSSPVRAFLTKHANEIKKIAYFYSSGGGGSPKIFEELFKVTQIEPLATLPLAQKEIVENPEKIDKFIQEL